MTGACPRCPTDAPLTTGHGALGEHICPRCNGRFLPPVLTERVLTRELGHTPEFLRALASHFAGARLTCPGCALKMSAVTLRGTPVDLCLHCGGLWLDRGELTRLTVGRHVEVDVPPLLGAPPPSPVAFPPTPRVVEHWLLTTNLVGELDLRPTAAMRSSTHVGCVGFTALAALVAVGTGLSSWAWSVGVGVVALAMGLTDWHAVASPGRINVHYSLFGLRWMRRVAGRRVLEHRARCDDEGRWTYTVRTRGPTWRSWEFGRSSSNGEAINELAEALHQATGWDIDLGE